jgi:DNA-binding GntR family transcriptional regulator
LSTITGSKSLVRSCPLPPISERLRDDCQQSRRHNYYSVDAPAGSKTRRLADNRVVDYGRKWNGREGKVSDGEAKGRNRASAAEIVHEFFRLLHRRVYQPGDRVREQDLADRFGVSRGPVREALRILETKGIVRVEPMRGATVARLSDSETRETVEIAAALFALAMRHAVQRATPEEKQMLAEGVERLAVLADSDVAPRDFFIETIRLGEIIVRAARTPRIESMLVDVRAGWPNLLGALGFTTRALRRRAVERWRRISAALGSGDSATAERLAVAVHEDVAREAFSVSW